MSTRQLLKWNTAVLFSILLLIFDITAFSKPTYGDIFIVANENVPVETLSYDDINKIFLGKKVKIKGGSNIWFVIQKPGAVHTEFLTTHIKRTTAQYRNYWRKMLFSGKGTIPLSFEKEADLLSFISKNDGFIGYVSRRPNMKNVKIIRVE